MSEFARVTVTGTKEALEGLKTLGQELREAALRNAGYYGALIIRDAAENNITIMARSTWYEYKYHRNHPHPRTLKNGVIVKRVTENCADYFQQYKVTVRQGSVEAGTDAYYARWVERGHIIRPAGGELKGGKKVKELARAAHHAAAAAGAKGMVVPPHAFMRPAYQSNKTAVENEISVRLLKRIQELGAK